MNSLTWTDDFGQTLYNVHPETEECHEYGCPIHAPSDHCMRDFKRYWRFDRGLMERICPHGVGHPDPDDLAFKLRVAGTELQLANAKAEGIHGCDGCCREAHANTRPLFR